MAFSKEQTAKKRKARTLTFEKSNHLILSWFFLRSWLSIHNTDFFYICVCVKKHFSFLFFQFNYFPYSPSSFSFVAITISISTMLSRPQGENAFEKLKSKCNRMEFLWYIYQKLSFDNFDAHMLRMESISVISVGARTNIMERLKSL